MTNRVNILGIQDLNIGLLDATAYVTQYNANIVIEQNFLCRVYTVRKIARNLSIKLLLT